MHKQQKKQTQTNPRILPQHPITHRRQTAHTQDKHKQTCRKNPSATSHKKRLELQDAIQFQPVGMPEEEAIQGPPKLKKKFIKIFN